MTRKHIKTRYALADANNIMNLPGVRAWFDGHGDSQLGFDRTMVVMGSSREEVARLYGPRDQTFTGEFRHDVWRIEHEGLYFWVLSAKTKGTGVEIEMPEVWGAGDEHKVISFLDNMYTELKALEDEPT